MRFGTDGVRGVAHTELTTAFAEHLARSAATVLGGAACREVVVGGDTRESTPAFEDAVTRGFRAAGLDVVRLGVAPTPLVAHEARRRGAMGAVVSASHNGYRDNGIKLFAPGGTKLADDVQELIESELARSAPTPPDAERVGEVSTTHDVRAYVDHVLSALEGRSLEGMRVVLDVANGAAHSVAPQVLRRAGAEVVVVADRPDGRNINDGCGATVPGFAASHVERTGADAGIALDGDADRLIALDHLGRVVDGDHVLAICAEDLRDRGRLRDDTVVVTVMSNLGFRLAMEDAGIRVVETRVGDRYVLEALAAGGYSLGGEQSGHVVFPELATTGDGVLTALVLLDVVARSGRPLAEVARSAMTSLPQVLVNVAVGERVPDVAERLAAEVGRVESELAGTGRVLLRASGTEPLIRVMVEAADADGAQRAADDLAEIVRARFA
ncbi:phosphoglucosamine mutase [Ilumatobacter sp.]|uniref:phosphoglucosamine mutase n=1 Tax=Ilumatobacter sp. TaxID=1967498 RepID=UPI003B52F684